MNARAPLQADREQIERFVDALFRCADADTCASVRAFYEVGERAFRIVAVPLQGGTDELVATACRVAQEAACAPEPVVFCPPIATLHTTQTAREVDLANGLALSVECDSAPQTARQTLEALLGPATVVVASGGEWVDPDSGEIQPKLHLHWRLNEPTRDPADHARLKRLRTLAARLAGGDPTNTPSVHPIRWPGSWHRKRSPRLARITSLDETAEIDLHGALEKLQEAAGSWNDDPASGSSSSSGSEEPGTGEERGMAALVEAILTGSDYHAPLVALAMRHLRAGMLDGQVVETLRGTMLAVPLALRDVKDGAHQPGRWQSRYSDIPRAVSTARAKIKDEERVATDPVLDVTRWRLDGFTKGTPPVQQFLLDPLMPMGKVGVLFGPGGVGKSITALDLCLSVATSTVPTTQADGSRQCILGGRLGSQAHGTSVFLTLEDDATEVHRRIAALDPQGRRYGAPCFVIPAVELPAFSPALVTAQGRTAALTEFAETGLEQMLNDAAKAAGTPVRLLVLDPAGDFLDVDENDATFVKPLMRRLRSISAKHGCTIILLGHVAKVSEVDVPSMRGSSAWIANSRFSYGLWRPSIEEAKRLGSKIAAEPESLVWGALVKANHAGAPINVRTLFARDSATGRLIDVTTRLKTADAFSDEELLTILIATCAEYAAAGLPYAYSGNSGLWQGREDLPEPLRSLPKWRLEALGSRALEEERLVKARTTHTQAAPKYLDIPDGPLAKGEAVELFHGSRAEALARYRERKGA